MRPCVRVAFGLVLVVLAVAFVDTLSFAQDVPGCEGPPELCRQILELQQALAQTEKSDVLDEQGAVGILGGALSIAVGLKLLISALRSWGGFFKDDRGKAVIRVIVLVAGLAVAFFTNLALSMPWWQAVLVAGGGPAAIVVHEIVGLVPVLLGKAKMPPQSDEDTSPM